MLKHVSRVLLKNFFAERSGLIIAAIIDRHISTKFDVELCISFVAKDCSSRQGPERYSIRDTYCMRIDYEGIRSVRKVFRRRTS